MIHSNNCFDKDLIIFDVETTSGNPLIASIVQIGAIKFSKMGHIRSDDKFARYVKPYTNDWDCSAENIHRISKDFLYNLDESYSLTNVLKNFEKWIGNTKKIYLGMWSNGFDVQVLRAAYSLLGNKYPFLGKSYDISSLVRIYLSFNGHPKNGSLKKCANLLGLNTCGIKLHDALNDAEIAGMALSEIIYKIRGKHKI